ncbi:MAG: sortase [Anaerolineae bacterium]
MSEERPLDALSVEELQQLLYRKKRQQRLHRLQRLRDAGRVVDVAGLDAPSPLLPELPRPRVMPTGAMRQFVLNPDWEPETEPEPVSRPSTPGRARKWANRLLLLVEIGAVIGLFYILIGLIDTSNELNHELAVAQRQESQSLALPTPTATPVIDVVVLPSGHKPPIDGRSPEPGEAGDIPAHLLPIINAYVPPPIPTPGVEQARRIQIPSIDVDSPIVQGDDWEQLKKGVGQHLGSNLPGTEGNLVLSAHNDIFGEIFRHLDKLSPGDEFIVSTERQSYTYIITKIQQVDPTDVWVLAATDHASATLISCYPYRVNNKRIIVFADLKS